jgi:hypothetical protein
VFCDSRPFTGGLYSKVPTSKNATHALSNCRRFSGDESYPSKDPLLTIPYGSASEYRTFVTLREAGCFPFRGRLFPLDGESSWAPGILITGLETINPSSSCLLPNRKSHRQIAPSRPPLANKSLWRGSQAMHFTVLLCPCSTWVIVPVSTHVIRVDWSPEQVAR